MPKAAAALQRCFWSDGSELYDGYHDCEWGRPVIDDVRLFEKISLEGFQAGLSWITILKKREHFRAGFDGFDFHKVATYTERDVERLLGDAGIVRHRGKIEAAINNAGRAIELQREFGSLARYFWQYEVDTSKRPKKLTVDVLRSFTTAPEAIALSKDLKKRGWKFVGPTTMYAFMQAMGLVNDHQHDCHVRGEIEAKRKAMQRP
ncbi:DNA-3-methyladenine glycosylase I [Thermomonas carbonis]|uniref:DNA-3-methyladenine glycosylase I n=1 Tax=Thermomonas carbonis TaxID=1463158 RepID=A0A7G9SS53_9GAMM|nr:DNA-3-methyladenine glycosylase I [Thermomonas carbonis]QNN70678.1 DNA-3-methyladenine glycosylase I [Thermomonas carbonis]GHC01595.1 DNA-3-methyladenine glycosylase I [Thermomonas carbonis]